MIHMVRAILNILDKSFYAHNILCGYYYTFFLFNKETKHSEKLNSPKHIHF